MVTNLTFWTFCCIVCYRKVKIFFREQLFILKAIHGPPDGALVLHEFYFCFEDGLTLGESAGFHLGLYPKVDLAVNEDFGSDKAGFVHFGENAGIEKGVYFGNIHWVIGKNF